MNYMYNNNNNTDCQPTYNPYSIILILLLLNKLYLLLLL